MPRHPPCALHSLSHKHSTKTTKTHNPTTPTIKKGNEATTKRIKQQPTPLRAQIAVRCSRPLSTCQTPTPPTPPTHDHAQTSRKRGTHEKPAPPPQTHDAGAVTGPISQRPRPDLSGPNSVPNTHPPTAGPRFHTRPHAALRCAHAGCTEGQTPTRGWFADDSTSEHHQCHLDTCQARGARAP